MFELATDRDVLGMGVDVNIVATRTNRFMKTGCTAVVTANLAALIPTGLIAATLMALGLTKQMMRGLGNLLNDATDSCSVTSIVLACAVTAALSAIGATSAISAAGSVSRSGTCAIAGPRTCAITGTGSRVMASTISFSSMCCTTTGMTQLVQQRLDLLSDFLNEVVPLTGHVTILDVAAFTAAGETTACMIGEVDRILDRRLEAAETGLGVECERFIAAFQESRFEATRMFTGRRAVETQIVGGVETRCLSHVFASKFDISLEVFMPWRPTPTIVAEYSSYKANYAPPKFTT